MTGPVALFVRSGTNVFVVVDACTTNGGHVGAFSQGRRAGIRGIGVALLQVVARVGLAEVGISGGTAERGCVLEVVVAVSMVGISIRVGHGAGHVTIGSLVVLQGLVGVDGTVGADSRGLGGVALAHLAGLDVLRQRIGVLVSTAVHASSTPFSAKAATLTARTRGIAVVGARTKLFLLAVVAEEQKLDGHGEEQKANGNNGCRQTGLLQPAGHTEAGNIDQCAGPVHNTVRISVAVPKGRADVVTIAVAGAAAVGRGNVDEAANEANVEDDGGDKRQQAACQPPQEKNSEQRVEGGCARQTLDGPCPSWNVEVSAVELAEEVGEDDEGDEGAKEDDGSQEKLNDL